MGSIEQEALARQLWNIFDEAYPSEYLTWDDVKPVERTAWIMVAQFVEARNSEPLATDADTITRIDPVWDRKGMSCNCKLVEIPDHK